MWELPGWATQLTVGEIVGLVAVLASIGWIGRRTWKAARRFGGFLDDFLGEESRPGVPARPGVLQRLAALEAGNIRVLSEVTPNGGSSAHDRLREEMRTELRMARDEIIGANIRLCEEVRQERASALAAHVQELHGGSNAVNDEGRG